MEGNNMTTTLASCSFSSTTPLVALLPSPSFSTLTPPCTTTPRVPLFSYDDSMILCAQKLQLRWQTLIAAERRRLLLHDNSQSQTHLLLSAWAYHNHHTLIRTMQYCCWPCQRKQKRPRSLTAAEEDDVAAAYHAPIIDPYQLLQVRRDAGSSEIKRAYRRLALWHHPARTSTTYSKAELSRRRQIFTMLAAAYETLCDPVVRRRYNTLLHQEQQQQPSTVHSPHATITEQKNPLLLRRINTVPSILDDDDEEHENNTAFPVREAPGLVDISMSDSSDDDDEQDARVLSRTSTATSNFGTILSPSLTDNQRGVVHPRPTTTTALTGNLPRSSPSSSSEQRQCAHQTCRFVLDCARGPSSGEEDSSAMPFSTSADGTLQLPSTSTTTTSPPHLLNSRTGGDAATMTPRSYPTAGITTKEPHYTQQDTDRLFGGPLQLLYRARRWRPFSDPYQVFESVFGTSLGVVLPASSTSPESVAAEKDSTPPTNSNANETQSWHKLERTTSTPKGGHTRAIRQDDGSLVLLTSRIVHHKRITRCERRWTDPTTGQMRAEVSVTSEALHDDDVIKKTEPHKMHPDPHSTPFCDDVVPFLLCHWEDAMCGGLCGAGDESQ